MSLALLSIVIESRGTLNADISKEVVVDVGGRTGREGGSSILLDPISPAKGRGAKGSDMVVEVGENDVHVLMGNRKWYIWCVL